jgi:steroid 5-alpha reductase family enzyme
MIPVMISAVLIVLAYVSIWFIISVIKQRNDVADIAWGIGYIVLVAYFFLTRPHTGRAMLVYLLVVIWGLRLATHIFLRSRGKTEDFRYKKWRDEWGKYFYLRSYFQVYILQGVAMLCISSPILVVSAFPQSGLNALDLLGLSVWLVGFTFEALGDFQLVRFIKDPSNRNKIMKTGLWKYTRHPNYFGEVTMWWGIFLTLLSSPKGIAAILSPLTITYLLLLVSGIPMLEKQYQGNVEFEEYKKRTSAFFPLPQRKI